MIVQSGSCNVKEQDLNDAGIYIETHFNGLWSVNTTGTWLASRRVFASRERALAYGFDVLNGTE